MTRYAARGMAFWALLPLTIMLMAASPHRRGEPLAFAEPPMPLPGAVPITAPANAPAYEPAPVPNRDVSAPAPPPQVGAQFEPSLFLPKTQFRGDGYMPGSTAQSAQEKNVQPAPGFNLRMPVQ